MTVAVDVKTGKVIGQVTDTGTYVSRMAEACSGTVRILSRDGYQYVPAASVRLEKV